LILVCRCAACNSDCGDGRDGQDSCHDGPRWIRMRSIAHAALRTRDRPQAAADLPAAVGGSLEEERGRTAQRRQQRGLRCDDGAGRIRRHAVERARSRNERRRRRWDRHDDERAQTRWAVRMRGMVRSGRGNAGIRARRTLRCERAVTRLNVIARRRAVVARIGGWPGRRMGTHRREQMQRQGDERDCEAAASCHRDDSTPRVGGRLLNPETVFVQSWH